MCDQILTKLIKFKLFYLKNKKKKVYDSKRILCFFFAHIKGMFYWVEVNNENINQSTNKESNSISNDFQKVC
jgi:hypothetical protein